jgi:peptidoglycan/xylan/chitin deacetylase (PgdA/CDA1 family)
MPYTNNNSESKGIILMYHRVADVECDPWSLSVSPRHFAEQLEVLKQLAYPLRLDELYNFSDGKDHPSTWVVITFDDGYVDNFHQASRILKNYDMPATFFLVSGYLGSKTGFWWDELQQILLQPGTLPPLGDLQINWNTSDIEWQAATSYSVEDFQRFNKWRIGDKDPTPRHTLFRTFYSKLRALPESQRQKIINKLRILSGKEQTQSSDRQLLSLEETITIAREKLFEIGGHTITHPDLASLPIPLQQKEISYPYGRYTQDTISLVRKSGFVRACSVEERVVLRNTDRFLLPRVQVNNWQADKFAYKISSYFTRF